MKMGREIPVSLDGARADVAVAEVLGVPRVIAREALGSGRVTIDGQVTKPGARVAAGGSIEGTPPPAEDKTPAAESSPLAIRYRDDRVLVVSKPAGMVTHPSGGHEGGTLVNALLGELGAPAAALDRAGIVHRLDKETSGLLLVARDQDALEELRDAMKRRLIHRTYAAIVRGRPSSDSGSIEASIGRHPTRRRSMAVVDGGRPAVTHYRIIGEGGGVSLLRVQLETGRTHQIRVHLAHLGHPIAGDRLYGGVGEASRAIGLERPGLHAVRLAFPHPDDGREIAVSDPLPSPLVEALERAGIHTPATF